MIDTDLLDVINSGDAWVFVGSGVSADSRLPTWAGLVDLTIAKLPHTEQQNVERDTLFLQGRSNGDFAFCFWRMGVLVGQEVVVNLVKQIFRDTKVEPGDLTRLLADWPAAGYVTTNYDNLLETALETDKSLGWISVGNQPAEVRKVSGDVRNIVWHIHGSAFLPDDKSKLVISSEDYDDYYLEHSVLQQQLKSFLTQRRLVFVGFGLRDPEIMRLLKIAGRYTVPERPIFAFLGSTDSSGDLDEIQELRDRYNIELIVYRIIDGAHGDLVSLINDYNSMVVRRSVSYGNYRQNVPSYDADTTGLLIYNTLVLQNESPLQDEALRPLLSARILSVAKYRECVTLNDLLADVGRISVGVSGERQTGDNSASQEIESVIDELERKNLITTTAEGEETLIRLTPEGDSFVDARSGVAERIRSQFLASLESRAGELTSGNTEASKEVATTASLFFEDCIEKRSLGVAKVLNAPDAMAREFQVVALLQALPDFFGLLSEQESAKALVKLVQGVLSSPSHAEATHCGLLLQARLGVHLLGVDQNTLKSRVQALRDMVFVLDSTSLIPLLAVSGTGHRAAVELMNRIKRIGAKAITTRNLVIEVREHAAYATRVVSESGGAMSAGVLNQLIGKEGERTNVFLSGFADECARGSATGSNFGLYMRQGCGFTTNPASVDDCSRLIESYDVPGVPLAALPGFVEEEYAEVDELRVQIEHRRRQSNSFRHDRQVLAEAEVVVLVQKLRDQQYTIDGRVFEGAFFVSNSRFIDRLTLVGLPVTMRQNVLFQWLGTVLPFEESELPILMDGLLWELSERGIDFVDRRKLRTAFSSTISAAKEEYPAILEQHKILIATEWGVDPYQAFQEPVDDLNISTLVPRHVQQTIDRQQRELERVKERVSRVQAREELSQSERTQLERLKSEKAVRVQKNRRKKRGRELRNKTKR